MTNYSPNKCERKLYKIKTIEQSIELNLPSIIRYKKIIGEDKIEAFIKLWLIDLNNTLDLNKPLKESQIDSISFYIMKDYGNLTVSDLHIIFTRAKTGYYGELYERLSMPKVLSWFREYFEDRLNTAGELTRRKHSQIKEVGPTVRESKQKPLKLSIKDYKRMAGLEKGNPKKKK